MGNAVGYVHDSRALDVIFQSAQKEHQQFKCMPQYANYLFFYELEKDEFGYVSCAPTDLNFSTQSFCGFESKKSFILVHIYATDGSRVVDTLSQQKLQTNVRKTIADLLEEVDKNIERRSVASSTSGSSFDFMIGNLKSRSSDTFYDIYCWDGNNAEDITKAVALAKSSSIEQLLKSLNTKDFCSILSHLDKNAKTRGFADQFNIESFASLSLQEQLMLSQNVLLTRMALNSFSESILKQIFSEIPAVLQNQTISILLPRKRKKYAVNKKLKRQKEVKAAAKVGFSISLPSPIPIKPRNKFSLQMGLLQDQTTQKPTELQSKKEKLAKFDKILSKITPNIYLCSETVIKQKNLLKENGITHVLNAAGVYCPEYFPTEFEYLTFHLYDGNKEEISAIFYEALEFIDDIVNKNKIVAVHCQQGVSRSSTLVILYLMWKHRQDFPKVSDDVKKLRGIVNPNIAFSSQLIQWYKRITTPITKARVYQIVPHNVRDVEKIAMRCKCDGFSEPSANLLDPRGAFIVQTAADLFIWQGAKCCEFLLQGAKKSASRLQKFEGAASNTVIVKQGEEPTSFWENFNEKPSQIQAKSDYDAQYALTSKPVGPFLFLYPKWQLIEAFSKNDLQSNKAYVLQYRMRMFVWCGSKYSEKDPLAIGKEFLGAELAPLPSTTPVFVEHEGKESDMFWKFFNVNV